jgi:hypothetical protein
MSLFVIIPQPTKTSRCRCKEISSVKWEDGCEVNVKGNTVLRHMNQIRNYLKKPPDVRHSSSHGLENVSSMRGYLKAAQNITEDG